MREFLLDASWMFQDLLSFILAAFLAVIFLIIFIVISVLISHFVLGSLIYIFTILGLA